MNTVFFPTPPPVWPEDMSVSSMKVFEVHMFSSKKWAVAPRCVVWDRFAKAYSTMFSDVIASTNAVFRYFSQPSGVPAERLGHAMAILGMNPTEDEVLWRQLLLLCFALRLLRLLLPSRANVHKLLKCFYHFYLPAAMRSKSIWQVSVVQNTLTKRCFTVS